MRRIILLSVLLLMQSGSAAAQVVRGRVLDAQGDLPVPLAEAILVTEEGQEVAKAMANVNGRFQISAREPGSYFLYAGGLGYFSSVEGPLWVSEGDTLDVVFRLQASPPDECHHSVPGQSAFPPSISMASPRIRVRSICWSTPSRSRGSSSTPEAPRYRPSTEGRPLHVGWF